MTDNNTVVELDSLVANEFAVEIDGKATTGIFRIAGLISYTLDSEKPRQVMITKMVQRDASNPFNEWLRAAEQSGKEATRSLAIVAVDDDVETRRWTLKDAYIAEVSYSDFDSGSIEMVEERITIAYASIEHIWSASG